MQLSARDPGGGGDGGHDHGPPLRGPLHPRPGRFGAAGRRGVVRAALSQAAGPDAGVHLDRAGDRRPGEAGRAPGRAVPAAEPQRHGHRQAAEEHHPPVPQGPADLPRGRGPEERRAVGRAVRRLAARCSSPRRTTTSTEAASPRASHVPGHGGPPDDFEVAATTHRRPGRRRRDVPPTWCGRSSPSTPEAWAPREPTSTSTCSPAWATRPRPPRSRSCTWPATRPTPSPRFRADGGRRRPHRPARQDPRRARAVARDVPHHHARLRPTRRPPLLRRAPPRLTAGRRGPLPPRPSPQGLPGVTQRAARPVTPEPRVHPEAPDPAPSSPAAPRAPIRYRFGALRVTRWERWVTWRFGRRTHPDGVSDLEIHLTSWDGRSNVDRPGRSATGHPPRRGTDRSRGGQQEPGVEANVAQQAAPLGPGRRGQHDRANDEGPSRRPGPCDGQHRHGPHQERRRALTGRAGRTRSARPSPPARGR